MLVRVQVRANIVSTLPHLYVYLYVCVYMSHNSVAQTMNVRLLRRLKENPYSRCLSDNTGVVRSIKSVIVS